MPHYEPSYMSTNSRLASYAKRVLISSNPDVMIKLDAHNDSPHTYTTGSAISGKVSITAPQSARFDEVQITLEGCTRIEIEQVGPVAAGMARAQAVHTFLKLEMPISESDYPQPRIAEAGRTFTFPFNFVIPEHLLPNACQHVCVGDHVHAAHLKLPPTIGDAEIQPLNDLSPDMTKVVYSINARVVRYRESDGKAQVLTSGSKKLLVLPTATVEPPLEISPDSTDYALIRTKTLRKGLFKNTKLGSLTLSTSQPSSFIVSPTSTDSPPSTTAILHLRFDPSSASAQPPRLGSVTTRIKASTFAATTTQADLARRSNMQYQYDPKRTVFTDTQTLSTMKLDSAEAWVWRPHAPRYARRDSGYESTSSTDCLTSPRDSASSNDDTSSESRDGYYEARLLIPLSLPHDKKKIAWLPTFHSCLISRIYTLDVAVSVATPGSNATKLSVRMPVQISCSSATRRGSAVHVDAGDVRLPSFEESRRDSAIAREHVEVVDQLLTLRTRLVPARDGAPDAPPDYQPFGINERPLSGGVRFSMF